jgi:hypothetical protein
MEMATNIIIIMISLELLEVYLQKAGTLGEMIDKLYGYYNKSIFLFFMVHPTFYFILFVSIYLNILNFYIIVILLIKTFDMFFKIEMIRQRYVYDSMDSELKEMLSLKLTSWMAYLGLFTHVPLLLMAITPS